ncbi:hypothetical protein LTR37_014215 [Vermiconidia calcicola]|uniref:Uncharacterized protein n=1 Tax=Vermiconidia calcicola TaxID=1690605 RepID=A0ACC3MU48_9PEZI|nr:hypothetical protein LTR37_014215 [Vermiconidia calcicola]
MYVFKYPEQSDRPNKPWYFRQTALYHQVRIRDRRSTYLMISPYAETRGQHAAIDWLTSMRSVSDFKARAFALHDVLLSCYLPDYRLFSTSLEGRIEKLAGDMLCVGLDDLSSVTPHDMVRLCDTQMRLLPQRHALKSLDKVLEGLDMAFGRWSMLEGDGNSTPTRQWKDLLRNLHAEITSYQSNAEAVLEKCETASKLLTGILEFHNRSIASQQESIAREQNDRVYRLTKFTVDDSITVRVVTTITLVFLSFATVAVSAPSHRDSAFTNRISGDHSNAAVLSGPHYSQARRLSFHLDLHYMLRAADLWYSRILAMAYLSQEAGEV